MIQFYAVVYTNRWGETYPVNLGASDKYENHDLTANINVANEIAEYMATTVRQTRYYVVKVNFEESGE